MSENCSNTLRKYPVFINLFIFTLDQWGVVKPTKKIGLKDGFVANSWFGERHRVLLHQISKAIRLGSLAKFVIAVSVSLLTRNFVVTMRQNTSFPWVFHELPMVFFSYLRPSLISERNITQQLLCLQYSTS